MTGNAVHGSVLQRPYGGEYDRRSTHRQRLGHQAVELASRLQAQHNLDVPFCPERIAFLAGLIATGELGRVEEVWDIANGDFDLPEPNPNARRYF